MILKHYNITKEEKREVAQFSNWILNIRNGTAERIKDLENEDATWVKIPEKYVIYYKSNPIKKIPTLIYNYFNYYFNNIEYLKQQKTITLKNKRLIILIITYYLWYLVN